MPEGHNIEGLRDSKKLSPKKRNELFEEITDIADIGVGIVSSREIDRINILQATYVSMKKAYHQLKIVPEKILVDGFAIPSKRIKSEGIIKGDEKVQEISAASIVAKVIRDKFMILVDPVFPNFEFNKNKGYGTKLHLEALKKYSPTLIHRISFAPVKNNLPDLSTINSVRYKNILIKQKKTLKNINNDIKNWLSLKNLIY